MLEMLLFFLFWKFSTLVKLKPSSYRNYKTEIEKKNTIHKNSWKFRIRFSWKHAVSISFVSYCLSLSWSPDPTTNSEITNSNFPKFSNHFLKVVICYSVFFVESNLIDKTNPWKFRFRNCLLDPMSKIIKKTYLW